MKKAESLERFYSVQELTELLGVSVATLYRYIKAGTLKRTKIGKLTRFKQSDVEAYLNAVAQMPVHCPATNTFITHPTA